MGDKTDSKLVTHIDADEFVLRFNVLATRCDEYAARFKEQCRIIEEKREENVALRKELDELKNAK